MNRTRTLSLPPQPTNLPLKTRQDSKNQNTQINLTRKKIKKEKEKTILKDVKQQEQRLLEEVD